MKPGLGRILIVTLALVVGRDAAAHAAEAAPTPVAAAPVAPAVEQDTMARAEALFEAGKYREAETLARRLLAAAERDHGPDSREAGDVIELLVNSLLWQGKYSPPETRALIERRVAIQRKVLGPDHLDLATTLDESAREIQDMGDLASARSLFEEALAIRTKVLGPDHPDVATSLMSLGSSIADAGDFASARPLKERALAIREKALGPDDPLVATSLNDLAAMLYQLGDMSGARALHERALAIRKKAFGADSPEAAHSLTALATVLRATGDYATARPLFVEALAIVRNAPEPDPEQLALTLMNFAALLQAMGDYQAAIPIAEDALTMMRKALGPDHPNVAVCLNNLAQFRKASGDYAAARSLLEQALAIQRKALGPDHPHVGGALMNLSRLLSAIGDFAAARPLGDEALTLLKGALGPDHPQVALALDNLASLLSRTGDYASARTICEEALTILRKTLGPGHPSVARDLSGLARLLAATGHASDAIAPALEAESIGREHLRLTAATLSQREALRYAATREGGLDVALSCAAAAGGSAQAALVLDQLVRSRGITLDVLAERRRVAALSPELAPLAHARTVAATRLATLTARGLGGDTPEHYAEALDAARKEMEAVERELGMKSVAFRQRQQRAQVGLAEVKAALAPGETLVASSRFAQVPVLHAGETKPTPEKDEPAYAAFVLKAGDAQPTIVSLGPAKPIEFAVTRWRNAATDPAADADAARSSGERLRKLAWDPIAALIGEARRVIVVPDGALLSVPLGALEADDGHYLVESAFTIACVSAERDLVRGDAAAPAAAGLLALGGADFAGTSSAVPAMPIPAPALPIASVVSAAPVMQLASAAAFRGSSSACPTFETMSFEPLPATAGEAEDIAAAWRASAEHAHLAKDAATLIGAAATEAAFKREAGRHRVLHVATHGFFLGADCAPTVESRGASGSAVAPAPSALAMENPLLRSGLALAGFNARA